jgi:hypothetical protein
MRSMAMLAIVVFVGAVSAQMTDAARADCVRVMSESVTLRGKPSVAGKAVDVIAKATQLDAMVRRDAWTLVQSGEYAGWVENKSIEPCTPPAGIKTPTAASVPVSTTAPVVPQSTVLPKTPEGRTYTKGPKGGCYYLSASGKKIYVDHSLCN